MLYPFPIRDILVELAKIGVFRAKWSSQIHDEWTRSLLEQRPDLDPAKVLRTRDLMDAAVLDCMVTGHEALIPALTLRDEDDRHVLAAAIHSRADAIVTYNLRDFPKEVTQLHDVEVLHPDEFLVHQIGLDRPNVILAAQNCRRRLGNPALGPDEYLASLERQTLPLFVAELRPYQSVI